MSTELKTTGLLDPAFQDNIREAVVAQHYGLYYFAIGKDRAARYDAITQSGFWLNLKTKDTNGTDLAISTSKYLNKNYKETFYAPFLICLSHYGETKDTLFLDECYYLSAIHGMHWYNINAGIPFAKFERGRSKALRSVGAEIDDDVEYFFDNTKRMYKNNVKIPRAYYTKNGVKLDPTCPVQHLNFLTHNDIGLVESTQPWKPQRLFKR